MTEEHERIKKALKDRGISFRDISRELGVSHTSVLTVSRSIRRSRRIESAIAEKLGSLPSELWPSKYGGKNDVLEK